MNEQQPKKKTSEKQLAYAKKYLDKMAEIKLRMTPHLRKGANS